MDMSRTPRISAADFDALTERVQARWAMTLTLYCPTRTSRDPTFDRESSTTNVGYIVGSLRKGAYTPHVVSCDRRHRAGVIRFHRDRHR